MLWNYLKIALRNILRNKLASLISIASLAAAFTLTLLIIQFLSFEWSYDQFHRHKDKIYRVTMNTLDKMNSAGAAPGLAREMDRMIPEIRQTCRIYQHATVIKPELKRSTVFHELQIYAVDSTFFDFFSFRVLTGAVHNAFTYPRDIWLSTNAAEKYFYPGVDPNQITGKNIYMSIADTMRAFTIQGIFEKKPNSHFQPDVLFSSMKLHYMNKPEQIWDWNAFYTFIKLEPSADFARIKREINQYLDKNHTWITNNGVSGFDVELQPIDQIYLHSTAARDYKVSGDPVIHRIFLLLTLLILACALINKININIATAIHRSRDIGIRKAIGAHPRQLRYLFMLESGIMVLISLTIATILAIFIYPEFLKLVLVRNFSIGIQWPVIWINGFPSILYFVVLLLLIGIFTTLISSIFPSFIMASVNTARMIRGYEKSHWRNPFSLRKILIGFQLGVSMVMIAGVYIVYRQVEFMLSQDLGFDRDNKVIIAPQVNSAGPEYFIPIERFKEALLSIPEVVRVSSSSSVPGDQVAFHRGISLKNERSGIMEKGFNNLLIDQNYFEVFGLKIVAGQKFPVEAYQNRDLANSLVMVNEAFMEVAGVKDPEALIGMKLWTVYGKSWFKMEIVGVVENYHQEPLHEPIEPVFYLPEGATYIASNGMPQAYKFEKKFITLHTDPKTSGVTTTASALEDIEKIWYSFLPNIPFHYFFLEDIIDRQYGRDLKLVKLLAGITVTIILIAAMGLFSLTSLLTEQRNREIGIRKTQGATVENLIGLLTGTYLKLILISGTLSIPVSWLLLDNWLNNYAYRISLNWWMFVLPLCILVIIAALTLGYHTFRTAGTKAARVLRYE